MRVNSKTTQTVRKTTYITIRMDPYSLFAWNFLSGITMKENTKLIHSPIDNTRVILLQTKEIALPPPLIIWIVKGIPIPRRRLKRGPPTILGSKN